MEFSNNEIFDDYVKAFKNLRLEDKKNISIEELKKTLVFLNKANEKINNKTSILMNRELVDLKSGKESEDDYVEAIFVYINAINELIASYVEKVERKIGE